mgnify:CR=1 FL=1
MNPLFDMVLRSVAGRRFCFVLLAMAASTASAQIPPDAGTLQRDTERELRHPPAGEPALKPPAIQKLEADAGARRVTVRRIVIEGATLIPVAELEALAADRIGQSLTLAELEELAQRITLHYQQRGWYARAYLPQQDVSDGVIRIEVLEGRYEGSRLSSESQRASAGFIEGVVTHRLRIGEPLSAADLERGILIANDLPGVRVTGLLEPGQARGATRLSLKLEDAPLLSGDIGLNNNGAKTTGTIQAVGGAALNNLTGIGDRISVRGLRADRVGNLLLSYSLPLGHDGWRLSAQASALSYRLGDRFKPLDAKGRANTAGLSLSYPLIRQSERNLGLSLGYERRSYADDMLGQALRRHRIEAFCLGLSGDWRDGLNGGGITWGGVEYARGRVGFGDVLADRIIDDAGPRTRGDYGRLSFLLNRLQALGGGWQLQAQLSGQIAEDNLDSSERFTLGGPFRVRAYPVNEASGDEGLLARLELQHKLAQDWQFVFFYDHGRIRQHRRTWANWDGGSGRPNRYALSGAGIGLAWQGSGDLAGWRFAASLASPLGGNPGKDAFGRNGDGSKVSSVRGWLALSRVF